MDRSHPACEGIRSDLFVALTTDQDSFVFQGTIGDIGDVNHREVHADPPANGGAFAANEDVGDIGEAAIKAIVVADGKDGEADIAGGSVGAAVADVLAGFDLFDLGQDGFPREDGAKRKGGAAFFE